MDLDLGLGGPLSAAYPGYSVGESPSGSASDIVKVGYLTSSQYKGRVLHFFQTIEVVEQRIDLVHRQRRVFAIVDDFDYEKDVHAGVTRCIALSRVEELKLPQNEMKALLGPFTEFDVLIQGSCILDFIRTIGALYSPNVSGNQMLLLEIDEMTSKTVKCHLYTKDISGGRQQGSGKLIQQQLPALQDRPSAASGGLGHIDEFVDDLVLHPSLKSAVSRPGSLPPHPEMPASMSGVGSVSRNESGELKNRIRELEMELSQATRGHKQTEDMLKSEINSLRADITNAVRQQQQQQQQPVAQMQPPPPAGGPPMWLQPHHDGADAQSQSGGRIMNSAGLFNTPTQIPPPATGNRNISPFKTAPAAAVSQMSPAALNSPSQGSIWGF
eukprot:TRINITY_DN4295_c0_g1_i1.p1 TRINITY_DN4295_c0_g1~~TRINITY_DN4295_c0_g1_i1.p1  ORF type:complete len:399 (+),score=71.50 TRINITY_DN4295_c0_g1_i1:46-1197(+)